MDRHVSHDAFHLGWQQNRQQQVWTSESRLGRLDSEVHQMGQILCELLDELLRP